MDINVFLKIKLDGEREIILNSEEAKNLYFKLKEIYEANIVIYPSIPTCPTYPSYPFISSYTMDKT